MRLLALFVLWCLVWVRVVVALRFVSKLFCACDFTHNLDEFDPFVSFVDVVESFG